MKLERVLGGILIKFKLLAGSGIVFCGDKRRIFDK
jgi:hypothetical protein